MSWYVILLTCISNKLLEQVTLFDLCEDLSHILIENQTIFD